MNKALTALVIDDHPVTHLGCRGLLSEYGFTNIGIAEDGESAMRQIDKSPPDLILLDIGLPGVGGLKLLPQILNRLPDVPILIFTMYENPSMAAMALEQGASGFLSKNAPPEDFLQAVKAVMDGQIYLESSLALRVATRSVKPETQLTPRELQILRLISRGLTYEQVAAEVHVSYKTVANASSTLRRKLSARSLSDLIRIGLEMELSDGDS